MNFVKFATSGVLKLSGDAQEDLSATSGSVFIIEPTSGVTRARLAFSGTPSVQYELPDEHLSNDQALVVPAGYGFIGESRVYNGFAPTNSLFEEDFQDTKSITQSGTFIQHKDFEDISTAGLKLTVTGTGITTSGLTYSASMEGNYHLALNASSNSCLVAEPEVPAASGVIAGRVVMLGAIGTAGGLSNQGFGCAFLRDSNAITSNCYKVVVTPSDLGNTYVNVALMVGAMTGSSSILSGTNVWINRLRFSSFGVRNANPRHWLIVEWEVKTKGILINIYHKWWESGDTIESVKQHAVLLSHLIYTGSTAGSQYYTNTTEAIAYLLGSTTSVQTGIDMLYSESLPSLLGVGLGKLNLLAHNTAVTANTTRVLEVVQLCAPNSTPPPQAHVEFLSTNPLIKASESVYGKAGSGYIKLTSCNGGDSGSDVGVAIYEFPANCSGVKHGTCRLGLVTGGSSVPSKLGLSFLRQGSAVNDNCYTLEYFRNGSSDYRVRLRKGTVYDPTFGDSSDFNGTILGTSVNLGAGNNVRLWLEVRWKATGTTKVEFEVLIAGMDVSLTSFDTSPGNVDTKLFSAFTYTDIISPYVSTNEVPLLTLRNHSGTSFGFTTELYKIELRGSKFDS